jgi:hypothetical protein
VRLLATFLQECIYQTVVERYSSWINASKPASYKDLTTVLSRPVTNETDSIQLVAFFICIHFLSRYILGKILAQEIENL